MQIFTGYLIFFISSLLYQSVYSTRRLIDDFKGVDSDFDLNQAIANFKTEDYENITEDIMAKITDLGPGPRQPSNDSSAEITKLLKNSQSLLDTPTERELDRLRRKILEEEKEELKNSTNLTRAKPEGKKRVKRQGKFQEAAKVDNLKVLRIYLTMFRNLWTKSYTGGAHPLHHEVPKPICILAKHRIMQFFFPPVGDEKKVR